MNQHLGSMGTNPLNPTTRIQNFTLLSPIKIIGVYLKYQSGIPDDIPGVYTPSGSITDNIPGFHSSNFLTLHTLVGSYSSE